MTKYTKMNTFINSQVKFWEQQKGQIKTAEEKTKSINPFITISREYGCGGFEVAAKIVEIMNTRTDATPQWAAYDKEVLSKIMEDMGLSSSLAETLTNSARNTLTNAIQTTFSNFPPQVAVFKKLVETERILATNGNIIIVGRAGNVITRDMKGGFHVRLIAEMDYRASRLAEKAGITKKEAEKTVQEKTKMRDTFIREFVRFDTSDPHNYHLTINLSRFSIDEAAEFIAEGLKIKGLVQ